MRMVILAGFWCMAALLAQVAYAMTRGRGSAFAPAAGSPGRGAFYAFTGAMAPWAKESVRMNPGSYALGMLFHVGAFSAFLSLIHPARALAALCLVGAAAGLGLLAKRVVHAPLRGLSHADDFVSNLLVTLFSALAGASAFSAQARGALPWSATALLIYMPLGKIRHCVFFFLSRYHFGAFFGRRGTFPPAR